MAKQVSPHHRTRDLITVLAIGIWMQVDHLNRGNWEFWFWLIVMILIGWHYASTEDDS